MSTTTAIALVALAVAAAFLHPAIIAVVKELEARRKREERERLEKELKDAVNNGNGARVCVIRMRLRDLKD